MNGLGGWLTTAGRRLAEGWDRFWFTPCSPSLLGILRILVGGMILYTHAVWTIELPTFFSDDGVLPRAYSRLLYDQSWAHWTHFDWIASPAVLLWVHGLALLVMFCFMLGFCTRLTGLLSFLLVVSYAHRATGALFGLDQINGFLTLYLAIGPSGQAWSLDRRFGWARSPTEPSTGANLSLRLMQVHMCIVYLFAGLAKLRGDAWWQGDALWGALASLDYQTIDLLWLAHSPWLIEALTLITLAWEVSYAFLIWFPACRPWYLSIAVLVHGGIGLAMGMNTFGAIMIIGNLAFLPPALGASWQRPEGQGRGVSAR